VQAHTCSLAEDATHISYIKMMMAWVHTYVGTDGSLPRRLDPGGLEEQALALSSWSLAHIFTDWNV
jgi:hypothetical protein